MDTHAEAVYFDPDKHSSNTWKEFRIFCDRFDLRYGAQYSEPPKTAMDSAIQRWHFQHPPTTNNPKPLPSADEFDEMRETWMSKDKVSKILGLFSSQRLFEDWKIAKPDEKQRKDATWQVFKTAMEEFYKPTENSTLNNYNFRAVVQLPRDIFRFLGAC